MKSSAKKLSRKGKMPPFTVRLPKDLAEALLAESLATRRTVSETLRIAAARHAFEEEHNVPLVRGLSNLQDTVIELGKDLETVARLLLVAQKLTSEEEARAWTLKNLRVGR